MMRRAGGGNGSGPVMLGRIMLGGVGLALVLLGGCSSQADEGGKAEAGGVEAGGNTIASVPPGQPPAPPPAKPFKVEEKTGLLEFSYAWPSEAAAVPAIAARLRGEMDRSKGDALKLAGEDRKSAQANGFPFHAHSLQTAWESHAATPRLLSLLGQSYVYTGGAHGMTGYTPLLWDRKTGQEVALATMLTSPGALKQASGKRFCAALDAARAEKRGAPVVRSGQDDFTACPDMMRQAIVPESKNGKSIDSLTIVIGPYEAGPYSEGSYDIPLPVDAAMLRAIKSDYREAFGAAKD
ncbi:DUF4163 domain-containing protein [Sphingobium aquiterrae]|uniref:DUF4163 domain-containing protein n=1 Tax=Sphingobium aquiterrae TaxID=2038656 RepID=UPI0030175D7E